MQRDQFFVLGSDTDPDKFHSQFLTLVLTCAKLLKDIDGISLKISVDLVGTIDRCLRVEQFCHHTS